MHNIYIVDIPHEDWAAALCRIQSLCDTLGAQHIAFMVTAVPNGEDPAVRLEDWVARFRLLRDALAEKGVRPGILIQALIGHGDRRHLVGDPPYQTIVGADGVACRESFCPLDRAFLQYTETLIRTLALERPAFFMIDDDFRLGHHAPANKGCMCPLHLARFATRPGMPASREAVAARLGDPARQDFRDQWEAFQGDTLVELATIIRRAIDSVDAGIPGSLAFVRNESHFAPAITRALAGAHPLLARINNAMYLESGYKQFAALAVSTRIQIDQLPAGTVVLTEADTCPHNRQSLSCQGNLAQITATLLMGCQGMKYWLPRTDDDGWADARPYVAMLASRRPFFEAIEAVRDAAVWQGPRVTCRYAEFLRKPWGERREWDFPSEQWASRILGRIGIPFTVGDYDVRRSDEPRLLSGTAPVGFSDDELAGMLAGPVLLDGDAAWQIQERGLGDLLGVSLTPGQFPCSGEIIHAAPDLGIDKETTGWLLDGGRYRLAPRVTTRVISTYVSGSPGRSRPVSPALTAAINARGGRVAVYGIAMNAPLEWYFFNGRHRRLLRGVLQWLANGVAPVAVETDLDVFALHGRDRRDAALEYLCLFNLNTDPLEAVTACWPGRNCRQVQRLSAKGEWQSVAYSQDRDWLRIEAAAPTMEPVVLRLR